MLDRLPVLIPLVLTLLAGLFQPAQAPPARFLSDLPWMSATNGLGPVERNQTNGGAAANDGNQIRLDGIAYDRGLGVSAQSDIVFDLAGRCTSFAAIVGMDDSAG